MLKSLIRTTIILSIATLPVGFVLAGPAAAQTKHHNEHKHDHSAMAKHGGTITEVGAYDAEILIEAGKIVVYIYDDHGDDISKKAGKGDAIFVVSGASKKVALTSVAGRLEGALGFETKPGDELDAVLRLVVAGKTHTGKAEIHAK